MGKLGKWKVGTCVGCDCEEYGATVDGDHLCVECAADYGWDPYGIGDNLLATLRDDGSRDGPSDADPGL